MATKPYYELHITCIGDKSKIEEAVNTIGWSFSAIDKDIIFGDGIKCYATRHFNKRTALTTLRQRLDYNAMLLRHAGIKVIRTKIEEVIYDERNP